MALAFGGEFPWCAECRRITLLNVVTGLVSGVLSGLIVSAVALLTSYLAKPRFELRYASSDAVTLRHNRLWPTVIGGTWEFGEGSDLFCTPDNRAAVNGILIGGFSETNLRNTGNPRPIGAAIDVTYKKAPVFPLRWWKKLHEVQTWQQEPSEMYGRSRGERDGWKVKTVTLKNA